MTRIAKLMALPLAWSVSAAAEVPRPELAAPRPFVLPRAIETTLPNGLDLTRVPYGTTPTARVALVIRAGTADDPGGRVGLAELVGEYLREGSRSRDADALARETAVLGVVGGGISVDVRAFETSLDAEVLAGSTPALVRLIGDLVQHPAFAPDALERLRANQARRLALRRGQAGTIAAARVNAVLFPKHPADRTASDEEVRALSLDDVRRFHAAHFVAARAHLYVAGRFDAAAVEAAAREAFEAWRPGEPVLLGVASASPEPDASGAAPSIHLIDRPGATQARIQISAPIVDPSHPDHAVLNQLNLLLGSIQTSRIIANVRERHGYSYNVSSRLIRRPGSSQWALTADVATDVTAPALREMLAEIARVVAEPPSADELRRFQTFMAGVLVSENATPGGILETLRHFDLYGVDPASRANFIARTRDPLPADIQRVAQAYLQTSRLTLVVVGDRNAIATSLASIGPVID